MVALNYARDVRIGDRPARAVALGSKFVWPPLPERLFLRGQSLVYDFVGQKYAARLPDDIIDYTTNINDLGILTRASTGTYWGPSGTLLEAAVDEARIQHDPVTGKALGLLIESNRTSAFPYSCDPETWNYNRGVVLEQGHPSPIPGYTSTRVSYDGEFTSRYVGSSQWNVHGLNSAAVIYRPINGSSVFVGQMATTSRRSTTAVVHSDGSVGYRGTRIDYLSVKPLPDGFLEVRFTLNMTGNTVGWVIGIGLVEETDSFDLAYFQNEQEVTPPSISHLITDGTDVTRAADNVVIDLADVLNPDEGTLVFDSTTLQHSGGGGLSKGVMVNASLDRVGCYGTSDSFLVRLLDENIFQSTVGTSVGEREILAFSYGGGAIRYCRTRMGSTTEIPLSEGQLDRLIEILGSTPRISNVYARGAVIHRGVSYYGRAMTDTELVNVTRIKEGTQ